MKRITAIALFTLANLVTVGSVLAQDPSVEASVPFAFTVGTKLLPSGIYTISFQDRTPEVLLIQNRAQGIATFIPAHADVRQSKHGELVFHKYGDRYFLSEILCSSCNVNMEIPTSKVETRAQLQQAKLHGRDQALVALK
jgi:hypothetical protein